MRVPATLSGQPAPRRILV